LVVDSTAKEDVYEVSLRDAKNKEVMAEFGEKYRGDMTTTPAFVADSRRALKHV
jgi:hypothetical protein